MINFGTHLDESIIKLAIQQAHIAESVGEVPVGAVLVDIHGDVVSRAFNRPVALNDPTAHAEILCLRKAGQSFQNYRLVKTTMYVTLEPCAMCIAAMVHARVARVVYTCPDLRAGACGTALNLAQHKALNHHVKTDFVEVPYTKRLLQNFFRRRR